MQSRYPAWHPTRRRQKMRPICFATTATPQDLGTSFLAEVRSTHGVASNGDASVSSLRMLSKSPLHRPRLRKAYTRSQRGVACANNHELPAVPDAIGSPSSSRIFAASRLILHRDNY